MNLLFLSTVYPDASQPTRGTYNAALCRALAESHRVQVVSPRAWSEYWPHRLKGHPWQPVADDCQAGISVNYPCLYYLPGYQRHRLGDWMWRSTRSLISRIQHEQPIDAVISYWAHPDGDAGLRAAQHYGVPSAVIGGGSDVLLLPKEPRRGKEVRRVLRETDIILTVSEGLRKAVIELDIDPTKVHTVYQGVDERIFHPGSKQSTREALQLPTDADVLLWVGRFVDVKRLDVLISAFAGVVAARPKALLCLIGSGPNVAECRQQVAAAGIEEHVRFAGGAAPETLGDWYRAADLTVMSSDSEGLPNVLRESLACGTPYVTTDVGNIREVDGGRSGRFVPKGDAGRLSQAIQQALDDVGRSLRVENHVPRTWRDMGEEIASLFEMSRSSCPSPQPSPPLACCKQMGRSLAGERELVTHSAMRSRG